MCFIVFAYEHHPAYRLILAANRDEFYDRPTNPAAFWDDDPELLAGRDLKAGGTWMGVTRSGRYAALTNYRDPSELNAQGPSRGVLVKNYLSSLESPLGYMGRFALSNERFSGFNLLAGDVNELYYYSNREKDIRKIAPGLYGLSNHLLDTPWPKVERGKALLREVLQQKEISPESLLALLRNADVAPDHALPETGVGKEWERVLSPIFIETAAYGTRSSTVLLIDKAGHVTFVERIHAPEQAETHRFDFDISVEQPS